MNNILFNDLYYNTNQSVCIGCQAQMNLLNVYLHKNNNLKCFTQ